jgi:hypothetical protein
MEVGNPSRICKNEQKQSLPNSRTGHNASGRRFLKHKWVFEIKRAGTFKALFVACSYNQIPGVDFTNVCSPVVHDVTFRIMLVAEIKWKLKSKIVDVESAFLNGKLEEEIYIWNVRMD